MSFKFKKFLFFIVLAVAFVFVFQTGVEFGKKEVVCEICAPQDINFSLFWEAYNTLKEKFVSPAKIDDQKMLYGAIAGMVKTLDDPYTVFFNPKETKDFEEQLSGTFEGIGIEIGIKENRLTVIAPLEGTPAKKAGLKSGDKILKIGDKSTLDMPVEEAIKLIRGPKGTEVVLTISRDNGEKPKEIKVARDVIIIPSLKWKLIENDIVYLQIFQFYQPLSSDFRKAALEILKSPAKKIILDLRNNPGGYFEVSQEISEWFLEKNQVIVIEDPGNGKEKISYKSTRNGEFSQYPMAVLINNGSASAAEILAGALKDIRGIQLIGEKSFGKGSVQEALSLREGSSLKITVAKWLTPNGTSISEKGLIPDVEIEMTEEDYKTEKDPQLAKALEIIRQMK